MLKKWVKNFQIAFRFPLSDPKMLMKWIEVTGITNTNSSICGKHFEKKCFKPTKKRKRLEPHAVTTLFLNMGGEEESQTKVCFFNKCDKLHRLMVGGHSRYR